MNAGSRIKWRLLSLLVAGSTVALFVAANAHLIYVAFQSQPDCVPHVESVGDGGMFRAARSSC